MNSQKKAYLNALLAVLFWSTAASAFKIALRELNIIQVLFCATSTSVIVLSVVCLIQRKIGLVARQGRSDICRSALAGFLNPFLYYVVLFKAYDLLPAQEAQPLNYTWPIVLSLLSVPLLNQKLGWRAMVGLLVSFAGVVIISTRGEFGTYELSNSFGHFLAVGSSVIWALFWILNLKDQRDPVVKLLSGFIFGWVYVVAAMICFSISFPPLSISFGAAVYSGVFEMGLTFLLWLNALRLSRKSVQVSNLAFLSPFLSLVFIHFILGEDIRASSFGGLVLIVSGILIQTCRKPAGSP